MDAIILYCLPEVVIMRKNRSTKEKQHAAEADFPWKAVLSRDARSNGSFVYGVRSTGIYCKPSCPSRRPCRDQVVFFSSPEAAEEAGFRACRRCLPRGSGEDDPARELVIRACRAIEASADVVPSLAALSKSLGASPHCLGRTFKRITGITPRRYAEATRLARFKSHIKEGEGVARAMYGAGYGSSSRLYEKAGEQLGMTPGTYRKGGKGMSIHYTILASPLGRLLFAATARGVCAVSFGDSDDELLAFLFAEYPAAELSRRDVLLGEWVGGLMGYLDGAGPAPELPLDVQTTAFQSRVWEELRKIPYGRTRTYGEIAKALGRPSAARAVARACKANPVAVVTPCHRVVREDGRLGGYRWGLERKQALLSQERSLVQKKGISSRATRK